MIRQAVVQGKFYPETKSELESMLRSFCPKKYSLNAARAAILPHAGYIYSGEVAAATVSRIIPRKKVLILGNNHTGLGDRFSLYPEGSWQTPLGQAAIDAQMAEQVLSGKGLITANTEAHRFEHSIEVQIPFLQYFFKNFSFLPLCCRISALEDYRTVAEQLYAALHQFSDDLIILASSDMTHYEPDQSARKKDRIAIESILRLDEKDLLEKVRQNNITMCGTAPVVIMLILSKLLGANKAKVIRYQTSGDRGGDYSAVVGYLGAIIT